MARSFSQALIRTSHPSLFPTKSPSNPPLSRLLLLRSQSTKADGSQLGDSDLEQQREALAVQRIEDAIHRIIVKRSEPDWLPFVPGSSYWVPPRMQSYGVAELVNKFGNALTEEEVMSLTSLRGWPSSAFFVDGAYPHLAEVDAVSKDMSTSTSKDDDG